MIIIVIIVIIYAQGAPRRGDRGPQGGAQSIISNVTNCHHLKFLET